jgi:hypothetical protein
MRHQAQGTGYALQQYQPLRDFGANVLAYYCNTAALEGSLASISDLSGNARTLAVSGTASARPIGYPRNVEQGFSPVYTFDSSSAQYAQDQLADKLTYWQPVHQPGIAIVWATQLMDGTGTDRMIWGNWGGATANQNSLSACYDGTNHTIYSTSKAGGGIQHLGGASGQVDTRIALRPGDCIVGSLQVTSGRATTLRVTRQARDTADNSGLPTLTTISGTYGTTPDTGAPDFGMTFGAFGGLGSPCAHRMFAFLAARYDASTPGKVARMESWLASRLTFPLASPDVTATLTYPTHFSDTKHQNDAGHLIVANGVIAALQSIGSALGWSGTKRIGWIGDSRPAGTGASVLGTTDMRGKTAGGTYTGWTYLGYGPIDDGSGNANSKFHFARSAYITITDGATLGHSPYAPHSVSLDVFVNAATGTHKIADCYVIMLGVNEDTNQHRDFVYEYLRKCEYLIAQRRLVDGATPAFVLVTEPVTGNTTTGPEQRLLRARNRGYSPIARQLISLGSAVRIVETNDLTYNH